MKEDPITTIINQLKQTFSELPDNRKPSNNTKYTLEDAGISAFSIFFMQCASFLEYQQRMVENQGRSNAQTLFGIHNIPSENQIRNLLDDIPPSHLHQAFTSIFNQLRFSKKLEDWKMDSYGYLLALDGTQHFSSTKINCEQCLTKQHKNKTTYSHQVITPIITSPNRKQVIPLAPEFVHNQDGQSKQDCEIAASKRWLEQWASTYFPLGITILGDDLYCHEPFCQSVLKEHGNFIFVCKPRSHKTLYEWVDDLEKTGDVSRVTVRRWNGKYHIIDSYRFVEDVPLRDADDALLVNWCELSSVREEDGKVLYYNAFATSHAVNETTVEHIVTMGRCRWKIENENNNTLKTKGYHFEHNFGHGKNGLCNLLATFGLLAYLTHVAIELLDERFAKLLDKVPRERLFDDMASLMTYFCFKSWQALFEFIAIGLVRRHKPDEIDKWILN